MPRLRSVQSGAVVNVSDETAARLGVGWVPVEDTPAPLRRGAKKAAAKPSDES